MSPSAIIPVKRRAGCIRRRQNAPSPHPCPDFDFEPPAPARACVAWRWKAHVGAVIRKRYTMAAMVSHLVIIKIPTMPLFCLADIPVESRVQF